MGRRNGRVTDNSLFFHRISGSLILKGGGKSIEFASAHYPAVLTFPSLSHFPIFLHPNSITRRTQEKSSIRPQKSPKSSTKDIFIFHQPLSSAKPPFFFFFFGFEVLGHHKASSRKVLLQTVLRCLGALFPAFSVLHDCPLVSSWPSSWLLSSFRCKTLFSLSITLLWNFERDADEGLLVGPSLFVPVGLLGGLMAPGEMGSMDVLDAYLEFLWDMW